MDPLSLLLALGSGLAGAAKAVGGAAVGGAKAAGGLLAQGAQALPGTLKEGAQTLAGGVRQGVTQAARNVLQPPQLDPEAAPTARGRPVAAGPLPTGPTGPREAAVPYPTQRPAPTPTPPRRPAGMWEQMQNLMIGPGAEELTPEARSTAFKHSLFRAAMTGLSGQGRPFGTMGHEAVVRQRERQRDQYIEGELATARDPRRIRELEAARARAPYVARTAPPERVVEVPGQPTMRQREVMEEGRWLPKGEPFQAPTTQTVPPPTKPTWAQRRTAESAAAQWPQVEAMSPHERDRFQREQPDVYEAMWQRFPGESEQDFQSRMGVRSATPPRGAKVWIPTKGDLKNKRMRRTDIRAPSGRTVWRAPDGRLYEYEED